jgi:Big-like domain-containing protein
LGFGIRYCTRGSIALTLALAATVSAQPTSRRATNIAALLAYPGFYHQRSILIVAMVKTQANGELRVGDEAGSLRLVVKGSAPDGLDEIRGEFWDLGRMKPDEPRLSNIDLRATFHIDPDAPWPKSGEVTAIVATAVSPASPPPAPSIRGIVLNPSRYLDQKVTVVGQYGGRNLLGDLPDSPAKSRYDFVLRSTDAAIWISNVRPKTKDFDLSLDARIDTGRWLQITGVVQQARGLQWLDGEAGTLAAAKPSTEALEHEEPIRVALGPPPEVVFSAPTQDESDVALNTSVRIQFSRDIDPSTIKGHVKIGYLDSQTRERGEFVTPSAEFTSSYNPANRVLDIRFAKPLERFRTVKVELTEGIVGTDRQPLKPWTLSFGLGGS